MTGRMRALLPPLALAVRPRRRPIDRRRQLLARQIARRDRFTFQDLVVEATSGIGGRPARLVMTTLGTVLGIAALVMTIGFAQTAARQIASQFDAVAATQVVITPGDTRTATGESVATARLPWDAPDRVGRLAGVEAAGLIGEVPLGDLTITAVPVNDPSAASTAPPPLLAVSGGLLDAVRGTVVTGRSFDEGHDARGDRVAVLGARVAERLGIARVDRQPSIFIGGIAYAVIGVVDDMQRRPDLKDAVIVPIGAARNDFDLAERRGAAGADRAGRGNADRPAGADRPGSERSGELRCRRSGFGFRPERGRAGRCQRGLPHPRRDSAAGGRTGNRECHIAVGDGTGRRDRPPARSRGPAAADRRAVHARVGDHRPARRAHRVDPSECSRS